MHVHISPEWEARLNEFVLETGRSADELVQDAIAGYFKELIEVRGLLDSRYDEIKSGKVQPLDGEAFFESLRRREDELIHSR